MDCSFKLSHYREILELSADQGFWMTNFRDVGVFRQDKIIILRHDVDFRLDRAFEMAKIEVDLGYLATYFIRLHSPGYNVLGFKEQKILQRMVKLGVDIGLHVEANDLQAMFGGNSVVWFDWEKKVLESVICREVKTAVEHCDFSGVNPKGFLKTIDSGVIHPYAPEFADYVHISDSLGSWTEERCACQQLHHNKLVMATHPCYWFKEFYHA